MSEPKPKRTYVHQGWDITVFDDGSFERTACQYPHIAEMETKLPKYRLHEESLEKMDSTKLKRIAMNLLVAATEALK